MVKCKLKKIIVVFFTIALLMISIDYKVYAEPAGFEEYRQQYQQGLEDPTENPSSWAPGEISQDEKEVAEKVGKILGIINIVGVVVSVITLMIIGIKYMFGSIEEKAEYKKTVMYYLIGAALIFSGTTIPNILYKIGTSINTM